jgi:hypothetical protein
LLGVPVRRLATIAHGDGICTTHVTCRSLAGKQTTPDPVESGGNGENISGSGGLFL